MKNTHLSLHVHPPRYCFGISGPLSRWVNSALEQKPHGLRQLAEADPLLGDLIVEVRIITVMYRNKPPFRLLALTEVSGGDGGQIGVQKVKLAIKNIIPESIPEPPF